MELKEKINSLMKSKNIKNVKELSKKCGVPYTTLRSILNDEVDDIRVNTALKLCDFFNITLDELLSNQIDISTIELASYNGINIDGLNVSEIEEVKTFIEFVKNRKNK